MEDLIKDIATHFKTSPDALKLEPIQHGGRQRHNVYRLKLSTERYLLKRYDITVPVVDAGHTPLHIEAAVLTLLYDSNCQVPQLIWQSEHDHALLLEWCGESTLDALAQRNEKSAERLSPFLSTILRELCKIETCFTTHTRQRLPLTSSVLMCRRPCKAYWCKAKKSSVISLISVTDRCRLLKKRHSTIHGTYSGRVYSTRRQPSAVWTTMHEISLFGMNLRFLLILPVSVGIGKEMRTCAASQ